MKVSLCLASGQTSKCRCKGGYWSITIRHDPKEKVTTSVLNCFSIYQISEKQNTEKLQTKAFYKYICMQNEMGGE